LLSKRAMSAPLDTKKGSLADRTAWLSFLKERRAIIFQNDSHAARRLPANV